MKIETNAAEIAEEVADFARRLFPETLEDVEEFAEATKSAASLRAPRGSSGRLKKGIVFEVVKTSNRIVASFGWSKKAFYGLFVEYGTRFHSARPHVRPAFDKNSKFLIKRINARLARRWGK